MINTQRYNFDKKTKRIKCGCHMAVNSTQGKWINFDDAEKLHNNMLSLVLKFQNENLELKNKVESLKRGR